MPNAFGMNVETTTYYVVAVFAALAVLVVVVYVMWPTPSCPTTLHRSADGSLRLEPSGQVFPDMNAFQQWWHAHRDSRVCPIPLLTGARREHRVLDEESNDEQLYAKTPIYKVDDYEFSRIFGNERNGHMDVPAQNFNVILNQRQFDWPDKPLTSDERREKYTGLQEGFTAAGDLKSVVMSEPSAQDLVKEATQRYHEKRPEDVDCRVSRQAREVANMVAKVYESDPNYEPVITKVGVNNWEVNELKPRRKEQDNEYSDPVDNRVVDTANDKVDIAFNYHEKQVSNESIDPYFPVGDLPFHSESQTKDPFYGPVPGLERMFGPTFDTKKWY